MNIFEKLGMTEEQVLREILFMRAWDKFLVEQLGDKKHTELSNKFNRELIHKELSKLGASEEEINEACDFAESYMERNTSCS